VGEGDGRRAMWSPRTVQKSMGVLSVGRKKASEDEKQA